MNNGSKVVAVRVSPQVDSAISDVAKRKHTSKPEYLRRVIVERLEVDGGLVVPEPQRAA
jgi:hypothetical protein